MIKLNLGSGLIAPLDWTNIDGSMNARLAKIPLARYFLYKIGFLSKQLYEVPWPKNIFIHNLKKQLPFSDASVDYIYSSHLLEHLSQNSGARLIRECWRVLKPLGIIRIAVPDLYLSAKDYLDSYENDPLASTKFLKYLFGAHGRHQHRWMYDYKSLRQLLIDNKFKKIEKKKFKDSHIKDISLVEKRKDSLFIEAKKL